MPRIEIGEDVPVVVVGVVHSHLQTMAGFVRVLFHNEAVVLVKDRLTEFAAMRLCDFDGPGFHGRKLAPLAIDLALWRERKLKLVWLFGGAVRGLTFHLGLRQ